MNDVVILQALLIIEIIAIIVSVGILIYTYKSNSKEKIVEEINVPWNYSNKTKENNRENNKLEQINIKKLRNKQNKTNPVVNNENKISLDSSEIIPNPTTFEKKTNPKIENEEVKNENNYKNNKKKEVFKSIKKNELITEHKERISEDEILSITLKDPEDIIKKETPVNKIKNDKINKNIKKQISKVEKAPQKKIKESYLETTENKNKPILKKENKEKENKKIENKEKENKKIENKEKENKEKAIILDDEQFSFVSRSWKESAPVTKNDRDNLYTKFQEPMKGTQKNLILKNFENDSISTENRNGNQTKSKLSEYKKTTEKITPKTIKTNNNTLTNTNDPLKNNLDQKTNNKDKNDSQSHLNSNLDKKDDLTKSINFEKLKLGKSVIFNYKGDSYLSKIFEINNDLIKVKYKGQFQWIEGKDIKKLL